MFVSLRRIAGLAVVGLVGLSVGETNAQLRLAPGQRPPIGFQSNRITTFSPFSRPQVLPWNAQQFTPQSVATSHLAANTAVMGSALWTVPPWAMGSPTISTGPIVAPAIPSSLATTPGFNPYSTGSLSSSGYGGYSNGGYGSGYGYQDPTGAALQGIASVTTATGQYYNQIQQARLTREQSRQMAIETQRKQIEFDLWYDTVRPTTPKLIRQRQETALDEARNWASATNIWSGDALNQLLRSVIKSAALNRGPNIGLDDDTLKRINLTDGASRGNVGLLRDGANLNWPLVLQADPFDETGKKLGVKLKYAVDQLKDLKKVEPATLRDADVLFKTLNDKLNDSADDLSPAQYIEAKRYLNQVGQAIRALKEPRAANYFNNTWNAKGKNVAELVEHLRKEGLEFAPATSGDEAAYNTLYNALRNFESGMRTSQNK